MTINDDPNQNFSDFCGDKNEPKITVVECKPIEQKAEPYVMPEEKDSTAQKKIEPQKKVAILASANGLLVGSTLEEQWRLAGVFFESRSLPRCFDSQAKVLTAMQLCYELNMPFLISSSSMVPINDKWTFFGGLPLAIVDRSKMLESIEEYFIDKKGKRISVENGNFDEEVAAAVCTTVRRGRRAATSIFTVKDAIQAKVWGTKVWAVYPKIMLKMRARSINLKDNFADALMGATIAEYHHDLNPEAPDFEGGSISTTGRTVGGIPDLKSIVDRDSN